MRPPVDPLLPTLPPTELREQARRRYGQDVAGYEAGRPEYPIALYELLVRRCGLGPGTDVLEIGPGSGRVTRWLTAAGARVVAVEPDPVMARTIEERFAGEPVEVVADAFESATLPDDAFDLVVAATSFHWVEQDVGLPRLSRVLRPGGWVALWWTLYDDPVSPAEFAAATRALIGRADPSPAAGRERFELDALGWEHALCDLAGLTEFEAVQARSSVSLDPPQIRAFYGSMIAVRNRALAERERLLNSIEALACETFGGPAEFAFLTGMHLARRPGD